jgi:hypothetical protein
VVERYTLQIVTAELQTANVAYFQRKIQLSGFSAYPDSSPSKLFRISGILKVKKVKQSLYRPGVAQRVPGR